ncbi:MAG: glycosyltransferase family 39 protein [Bacteroidetes bacterium]|nr:glycosyltransferase family 39 protein [Bacteroidota bacterium]
MLAQRVSKILFFLLLMATGLLAGSFLFFYFVSYESLVTSVLNEINRMDLYPLIKQQYFPLHKYHLVRMIVYGVSITAAMGLLALFKYRNRILTSLLYWTEKLLGYLVLGKQILIQNTRLINIGLLLSLTIILLRSIYYAATWPIQYDEAWNYNYFLHKNIFYSIVAYNNYPLHNLVSRFFLYFLPDHVFVLRLPSILMGLCTCLLVFVMVKKITQQEWLALMAMIVFACLPVNVFYMLYARGVLFEVFFALLLSSFIFFFLKQKITLVKIGFLAILNALGTYSMLSHGYFIASSALAVAIYLLFQTDKQVRFIILYPLLSILFSAVLLTPMMLGTGMSLGLGAGLSNGQFTTLPYLPFHSYADFATGSWWGFYVLIALNIFLLFIKSTKEYRWLLLLNMVLICTPFVIKFITGVTPPERALAFLVLVPLLSFVVWVKVCNLNAKTTIGLAFVWCSILVFVVHRHQKLNWSKQLDHEVYTLSKILATHQVHTIYNKCDAFNYFVPGLEYYALSSNKSFNYTTSIKNSSRYKASMNDGTDCVIEPQLLADKKWIYHFEDFYVYLLNEKK